MIQQQVHWHVGRRIAQSYQERLVPAIFAPWATSLVGLAAPQPGERVLDVACGTGVVTRLVAHAVGDGGCVAGIDINRDMLATAAGVLAGHGVALQQASALALPYQGAAFQLVLSQQGLPFFPDRLAALREMRRVLADDGRLALTLWASLEQNPGFRALIEAAEHFCGPQATPTLRASFSLGDMAELRTLLAEAGFELVSLLARERPITFATLETFVEAYSVGSPLALALSKLDEPLRHQLLDRVRSALAPAVEESFTFPMCAHLVLARPAAARTDRAA